MNYIDNMKQNITKNHVFCSAWKISMNLNFASNCWNTVYKLYKCKKMDDQKSINYLFSR